MYRQLDRTRKQIIQSKLSQTQKDKYGMHSLMWMLAVKSLICKLHAV